MTKKQEAPERLGGKRSRRPRGGLVWASAARSAPGSGGGWKGSGPGSGVRGAGRGRPGGGGPSGGGPGGALRPARGAAASRRTCAVLCAAAPPRPPLSLSLPPSLPLSLPPSLPPLAAVPSPAVRARAPQRRGRRLRARETPNRWPEPQAPRRERRGEARRAPGGEGGRAGHASGAAPGRRLSARLAARPVGGPAAPASSLRPWPRGGRLRGARGAGWPRRRRRHESDRVLRADPGGRAVRGRPHESFQPHPASGDSLPEGHRQGEGPGARGARGAGGRRRGRTEGERGKAPGSIWRFLERGGGRRGRRGKGKCGGRGGLRAPPGPGLLAAKFSARPGPRAQPRRPRRAPAPPGRTPPACPMGSGRGGPAW